MSERSLSYSITAVPAQHLLRVTVTIRGPLPEPLQCSMPAWTPGSYLVREYARHVEGLQAHSPSGRCGVRKLTKDTWAIAHGGASEVTLEYNVYAHDLTVRTNHVSDSHAYWNGAATYLRPVQEGVSWDELPAEVTVTAPEKHWSIATGLTALESTHPNTWRFQAAHFDELCDCPIDMGVHETLDFRVLDKPHRISIWGARARIDRERLVRDVTAIVETEAAFFGGLPYDRYVFLLHLSPGGRGGLEHRNSCTLLCSPDSFDTADGYDDVLSLIAHEFLHLWHVKRTRPAGLFPYDYRGENYTRMLWLFEGGTSYYDWLFLRKAGLVDPKSYLKHLASELARLEDTPGRFAQSLEEASFDAWIKLYRPDEHSVNSTVSYYLKGEIVCALLDLELRSRSKGQRSLDDVMKYLWTEFGEKEQPIPESHIEPIIARATGIDLSDMIEALVRTTQPLPYERVFAQVGLLLRTRPARGSALGIRLRNENGRAVLSSVLRGGPADLAGLAPGDEVIAIDQRRVDESSLRDRLKARKPGETVVLTIARREELQTLSCTLGSPPPEATELVAHPEATAEQRALGEAWLGTGSSALWSSR